MNDEQPAELRVDYGEAFFLQAKSDWEMFRLLEESRVRLCHRLHYLQMACEKLAKAYRLRDTASPVSEIIRHHTGFEKFMGAFLLVVLRDDYGGRDASLRSAVRDARRFARAIEALAPAVDRDAVPENTEYPWQHEQTIIAPCTYEFPSLPLLTERGGRAFLKQLQRAFDDYSSVRLP